MRLFTEDLNGDVFILLKSVVHQKIPTSEDLYVTFTLFLSLTHTQTSYTNTLFHALYSMPIHSHTHFSSLSVRGTFQLTGFQLSPVDDTHTQITYISQIDWDLDCAKLAKLAKKLTVLPKLAKILAKSKK